VSIISCIEAPKVTNYAPFISNPIIRANLLLLEFGPHVLCNLAVVGSEKENQFRWDNHKMYKTLTQYPHLPPL